MPCRCTCRTPTGEVLEERDCDTLADYDEALEDCLSYEEDMELDYECED